MNNISVFEFESNQVRFVDEKPVGNDIAKILGYSDPSATISKKVFPEYKGVAKMETPGGSQLVTVLGEPGVYQLIFGSKLESAKRFQRWIFEEVLPSIRKTGSFSTSNSNHVEIEQVPGLQAIASAIDLVLSPTGLDSRLIAGVKANQIAKHYPALASAMEESKQLLGISVEENLVRPGKLAELYEAKAGIKLSAQKMNKLLAEKGLQIKNATGNPSWLPTGEGKQYSELVLDTAKGHNKTVQSLQWHPSVIEVI